MSHRDDSLGRHLLNLVLLGAACLGMAFGGAVGCGRSGSARIELRSTSMPENAFTIAGEARAFVAKSAKDGARGEAKVSLAALQKQFGRFDSGRVFAFGPDGRVAGVQEVKVSRDGKASVSAVVGHGYLFYPDLNNRIRATYGVLCKLGKLNIPEGMIPAICTRILCGNDPLEASDLIEQVPGIEKYVSAKELGRDKIGGFGRMDLRLAYAAPGGPGGGGICERCIPRGVFYPDLDCNDATVVVTDSFCSGGDRVVYFKRDGSGLATRIHVMDADGSNDATLTPSGMNDSDPDVNLRGDKIVFVRSSGSSQKLFTMNIDGASATEVPDTTGAFSPVWGRGAGSFIVFTAPVGGSATAQTAIWRVGPASDQRVQMTFPAAGESDGQAAVVDAKFLVFTRQKPGERELWIQDMWDDHPTPTRLTSIPDGAVKFPVAGHIESDSAIAFVAAFSPFAPDEIRVCRLSADQTSLSLVHTVHPDSLVEMNIMGIDFSKNDQCLFFAAQSRDVILTPVDKRFELFSCSTDGSNLRRTTSDETLDGGPTTITGSGPPPP